MDSSVEIAEDFMDTKNCVDTGLGVGVYLFNGVEVWGSGAGMRQSTSKDDAHDKDDNNEHKTIDRRRRDDDDDDGGDDDDGSCTQVGRPNVPIGGMGYDVTLDDGDARRRRRSTTTTTSNDDDSRSSSCSVAKTRAAAVGCVGPTPHGPEGSHLGLVIACAGVPGLGIDSPTMPGMDEDHTHPSRGSLSRTADGPVRSNVLRLTGMSTTGKSGGALDNLEGGALDNLDFDGAIDIFDFRRAVRPSVLSPTGTSATKGNQYSSVNISPGGVRPTRIMAECSNEVDQSKVASSPTTPVAWPTVENGTVFVPPLIGSPTSSSTCSLPTRISTGSSLTSGDCTSTAYRGISPDPRVGDHSIGSVGIRRSGLTATRRRKGQGGTVLGLTVMTTTTTSTTTTTTTTSHS